MFFRLSLSALALVIAGFATPSWAGQKDKIFFESVEGSWRGPGEIVAGKYKGTKFVCKFKGAPSAEHAVGVAMDGHCRVGIFSQKMSAFIGGKRGKYSGRFQDGAKGDGLDIISGQINGNKIVVGLNRKKLDGAMVAHLEEPNVMNVTISVKVRERLIPVIGMTLSRERRVGASNAQDHLR
ncbi:hypothetical protein [Hoeflea poritis]|uniref:Uncharacterized protein n=1 Tax=Hoeflea poritis TaxID=2993659 RepID=A0ABT4VU64_9HYPH|nr:hypothetical protein [Hoeflea poritis]MDA4848254.1 hypothetical protein [Hoeflea poritis]